MKTAINISSARLIKRETLQLKFNRGIRLIDFDALASDLSMKDDNCLITDLTVCCTPYRGPAGEWHDAVCMLLRQGKAVREWFAKYMLFSYPDRFSEYLLECPSGEVR